MERTVYPTRAAASLAGACLILVAACCGCTRTLAVRVIDAETGAPIFGATVKGNPYVGLFYQMTGLEARTGPDGVARLSGPGKGLHRVSAGAPGYGRSARGPPPGDADVHAKPLPTIALWRRPLFTVEYHLPTGYRGVIRIRRYPGQLPPAGQRHVVVSVNPPDAAQDPTGGVEIDTSAVVNSFFYADGQPVSRGDLDPNVVGLRADKAFHDAVVRSRPVPPEDLWVFFLGTDAEMQAFTRAATAR
jgi:hypothetical protein